MSKSGKFKGFMKRNRTKALFVAIAAIGTGIVCAHQRMLFKSFDYYEREFNMFANDCTKAVLNKEEVTSVMVNEKLGKKVLVKIKEIV